MIKVILPIFNQPEYTKACLEALRETPSGVDILLVIVDNGSRRRTKTVIANWPWGGDSPVKELKVITLPENSGFAGAVNAGAKAGPDTEFTCIMHNDTIPFPGWAGEMLTAFEQQDKDISIVMPRTSYANEQGVCLPHVRELFCKIKPPNKDYISAADIMKMIGNLYPQGTKNFVDDLSRADPRYSYSIDPASFCMMFRSELFADFGYFDEEFFPRMFEDKFWFLPMERSGMACCVANRAFVHHFGNITTDGPGFAFPDISAINEKRFKRKVEELNRKFFRMTPEEVASCQTSEAAPSGPPQEASPGGPSLSSETSQSSPSQPTP